MALTLQQKQAIAIAQAERSRAEAEQQSKQSTLKPSIDGQSAGVFTESQYKPGGIANPENINTYNKTGEQMNLLNITGLPTTARSQQVTNPDGTKQTYLVPRPAGAPGGLKSIPLIGGIAQGIDAIAGEGVADRTIGGGVLEMIKGSLGFGEFLLDNLTGVDPAKINQIGENFPTIPANNDIEKAAQTIVSVVSGGATGGGVVTKLDDIAGMTPAISNVIVRFWDKARVVDPANAVQKLNLFVKSILNETGQIAGSTVTVPQNTKSMSQNMPFNIPSLPEQVGTLSKDETQYLAHAIDNTGFSVGFNILAKGAGLVGQGIKHLLGTGNPDPAATVQVIGSLLKQVDPNTLNTSPEEFARRATIMAEIAQKNKSAFVNLTTGPVEFSADTAMALRKGAREYAERVYEFRRSTMSPEEFNIMVDKEAQIVMNNLLGFKRGRLGSTAIQNKDAEISDIGQKALQREAESLAPTKEIANEGVLSTANDIVQPIQSQNIILDSANVSKRIADSVLSQEQTDNQILQMINAAQRTNPLGSNAAEKAMFRQMNGEQRVAAYRTAKQAIIDEFDDLPDNVPVDVEEFAAFMKSLGDERTVLESFGIAVPPKQTPVIRDNVVEEGVTTSSPIQDYIDGILAANNGVLTLKALYQNLRPVLARRINILKKAEDSGQVVDTDSLVRLKNWIDQAAEESGDPRFGQALDNYAAYADKWLKTDDLRNAAMAADAVQAGRNGSVMNSLDANKAAMAAYRASEQEGGDYFAAFVNTLQQGGGGPTDPNIAMALSGQAINLLVRNKQAGIAVDSTAMSNAINPYLESLRIVPGGDDVINRFERAVADLNMAETGSQDAADVLKSAQDVANELITVAESQAAVRFVVNVSKGNIHVTTNADAVFEEIFKHPDSEYLVMRLIEETAVEGDDLARRGIQSQMIRYLEDVLVTTRPIAVAPGGADVVRQMSPAQLQSLLSGFGNNTLKTLRSAFSDKPETADGIIELLSLLRENVDFQGVRVQNFGSNTAVDESLKAGVKAGIRIIFGVLNRTATIVGTVAGALMRGRKEQIETQVFALLDRAIVDPEFFSKALQMVADDATGATFEAFWRSHLNMIQKPLIRGTLTAVKPSDEEQSGTFQGPPSVNQQTNAAFDLTKPN